MSLIHKCISCSCYEDIDEDQEKCKWCIFRKIKCRNMFRDKCCHVVSCKDYTDKLNCKSYTCAYQNDSDDE